MNRSALHDSIIERTQVSFSRSGGAGGQNVNKVSTKVHAFVPVTALYGITEEERERLRKNLRSMRNKSDCLFVDVQDERSQERNRVIALERLEQKIVSALRVRKKRVRTKPTRASQERRLALKKLKGEIKRNRQKQTIQG